MTHVEAQPCPYIRDRNRVRGLKYPARTYCLLQYRETEPVHEINKVSPSHRSLLAVERLMWEEESNDVIRSCVNSYGPWMHWGGRLRHFTGLFSLMGLLIYLPCRGFLMLHKIFAFQNDAEIP